MRTKALWGIVAILALSALGGCKALPQSSASGSESNSQPSQPSQPAQPANTTQLSVTLRDAPPSGVSVLSFEVNITKAALQPMVGTGEVSLLPGGDAVEIEVKKLETESAVLSTISAPSGTYSGLEITLSDPTLTVFNGSGSDIGACKMNTTCQFKPTVTGSVVFSAAPFPLTLVAGTPAGLQIDILLNKIINADLTVVLNDPSVINVSPLTATSGGGNSGELNHDEFSGIVSAVDAANKTFAVQNSSSAMAETIHTDANTRFEDFEEQGCSTEAFTCIAASQTVEVETLLESDGSILAKEVKLEESKGAASIDGTLVSLSGNPATQFQMVVLDEELDAAAVHVGDSLAVALSNTTKFNIGLGKLAIPAGGSFAGPADLLPGQNLQIVPGAIAAGPPVSTDASQVTLRPSQFTATVSTVTNGSEITVVSLPSVFGLTSLTIETSSATEFEDIQGASSLSNGSVISIRGLLFHTASGPMVVAAKIRQPNHDED